MGRRPGCRGPRRPLRPSRRKPRPFDRTAWPRGAGRRRRRRGPPGSDREPANRTACPPGRRGRSKRARPDRSGWPRNRRWNFWKRRSRRARVGGSSVAGAAPPGAAGWPDPAVDATTNGGESAIRRRSQGNPSARGTGRSAGTGQRSGVRPLAPRGRAARRRTHPHRAARSRTRPRARRPEAGRAPRPGGPEPDAPAFGDPPPG